MNPYIGQESQLYGVEEYRLVGGKGDGMRLLQIRNGKGLEMTVSPDRCADISRVSIDGMNVSYFSPCGYVAPAFYQKDGTNWLKSFTAGFLTTCGLEAAGSPCVDEGEVLPLHGSIANTPAEHVWWYEEEDQLIIRATVRDEVLFGRKYVLERTIRVSLSENVFTISDKVINTGDTAQPLQILYHMNMGYPLLDEDSVVTIPADSVTPRDAHAAEGLSDCLKMEVPQRGYQERCFYHHFPGKTGCASIYQPKANKGLTIEFDTRSLDCFVEWKMMGYRDYVLGLEPGNCFPDGRNVMREKGLLKYLQPGESETFSVTVRFFEN